MQHASPSPHAPVAGIDWATQTNTLCIIDRHGQVLRRLTAPADAPGSPAGHDLAHHGVAQVATNGPTGRGTPWWAGPPWS